MSALVHSTPHRIARLGLVAGLLAGGQLARADGTLDLAWIAANTATDEGPQDGIFDAFAPFNFGSVNDNGWTSFRTAMEFSLAGLPPASTITSAKLRFVLSAWEGTRFIAVHAYPGDGVVTLDDFSRDGLAGAATVTFVGVGTLEIDVSDAVRALASTGATHVGLALREDPPNAPNYLVMNVEMREVAAPVLRIAYSTTAPPVEVQPLCVLSPSPSLLWPPRHQLVPIELRTSASDACAGAILSSCVVVSSEPEDAFGDGATTPDVAWVDGELHLRAERAADGHGRTYAITCDATDAAGNATQASGIVTVPHDARPRQ